MVKADGFDTHDGGEAMDATSTEPVNKWRLWRLKLKRNHEARQDALATVRQVPSGHWVALVGGRTRGAMLTFGTRQAAVDAVNDHYNERFAELQRRANG
jgi:hypothetical protein